MVAALFAFSCTTDVTDDLGVQLGGGQHTLSVSLDGSRTQLGEKADGVYPLLWSEGDAIAVNGTVSAALTAEQAGQSSAQFTYEGDVVRPYNVVYPAPAEGVVAETEGLYPVTFLAAQQYVEGTFCNGAAPMYGFAAAESEGAVQLNHLAGVIRLAVKGDGVTLRNLTITAEKGKLSGNFDVDCATGVLTAHSDASESVTVSFGGGLTLKADEATPIYVAVPAGDYGVITLLLNSTTDIMRLSFDSSAKPVSAGSVREFAEFIYKANSTESEVFLIDSKEALLQFAQKAADFAPYTTAKVTAPIDMTGEAWSAIEGFGAYVFDGGNFEIKGLTAPLFGTTAATIKNVKLVDVAIEETEAAYCGSIARRLDGSLIDCSATGTMLINNTTLVLTDFRNEYADICHGGLVGITYGATVKNCTNDIDITITSYCAPTLNCKVVTGGLVGAASYGSSFDNLVNNGDIIYNGDTLLGNQYIAGVVGKSAEASIQVSIVALSNCTNNGAISTTADSKCGASLLIAGIVGNIEADEDTLFNNLVNTADITVNGECKSCRVAGVIAFDSVMSLSNSSNSGDVTFSTGAKSEALYMAGVCGGTVRTKSFTYCSNSGKVSLGDDVAFKGLVNIVGITYCITGREAVVTNCTNSGPLSAGACTDTNTGNGGRLFMGGLFYSINGGTISDCVNEATGTLTANPKSWASRLMLGGFASYLSSIDGYAGQVITVKNCENKAKVTVNATSAESAAVGGFTAESYAPAGTQTTTKFVNCTNSGAVELNGTITSGSTPNVGGFFGIVNHPDFVFDGCVNNANVTVNATAKTPSIGGIVGKDTNKGSIQILNCTNKGLITNKKAVGTSVYMGGILGNKAVALPTTITNCVNLGKVVDEADETLLTADSYIYGFGGIVGHSSGAGLVVSKCTNGELNDTTGKGSVTIGKAPAALGLGGIVGVCQAAVSITDSKNYGEVKQTGLGSCNKTYRAHIAGILGVGSKGNVTITDCENYGKVEYGTVKANNRVDVAGITATTIATGTNTISNCKNGGTIACMAPSSTEICVAGIVGCPQGTTLIDNCTNLSTAVVWGGGACSTNYDLGGIAGGPSGATTDITNCKNYGLVKQTAVCSSNVSIGGIVGYAYSIGLVDKCENHGSLEIAGTTGSVLAGGLVGYLRQTTKSSNTIIKNSINYANLTFAGKGKSYNGGGVIGYATTDASPKAALVLENLYNFGNLTYTCTYTTPQFGGLIGGWNRFAVISNSFAYCNFDAPEGAPIGWISGGARSTTLYSENCAIGGGTLVYDAIDEVMKSQPIPAETYYDYMYSSGTSTDWTGTDNHDGCTYLTSKPTVTYPAE